MDAINRLLAAAYNLVDASQRALDVGAARLILWHLQTLCWASWKAKRMHCEHPAPPKAIRES
jgi:hypothetical protein